jgi:hypothetical protein
MNEIENLTLWTGKRPVFGDTHGDTVWNNLHAYTAYRNCLQSNDWIQPNSSNPRLITNHQFAGRL